MNENDVMIEIAKGKPDREGFVIVGGAGLDVRLCLSLRHDGDTEMLLTASECRQLIKALEARVSHHDDPGT
jgi:hypothetical protein